MHRFWLLVYFFMIPHTFDFEQDTRTLEIEQNTTLSLTKKVKVESTCVYINTNLKSLYRNLKILQRKFTCDLMFSFLCII